MPKANKADRLARAAEKFLERMTYRTIMRGTMQTLAEQLEEAILDYWAERAEVAPSHAKRLAAPTPPPTS